MHFTRHSTYDDPRRCRSSCAATAPTSGTPRASKYLDALAGLFVSQAGPRPHRARRGRRQAGRRAGLLPALVLRPPRRDRAGRAGRGLRPRRPQPGLLHQRRRRGRRDRVEARQELLQAHRQADEAQGDQPRDRLPRHHPGRAVDHRAARPQGAVRAAGALDLPGAEHELLPRPEQSSGADDLEALRPLGRRPDRRRDRERGPRHRRRGLPRAGAERRRLLPAAARLLPAGPRDLRRVRRAAGHRRGDLRLRAARPHVRRRALRLPARHDHLRQGPHLRLLPARRDDRHRPADRAVPARATTSFAHGYTFGGHPVSTAVAMANLDIFEREELNRARAATTRTRSARPWRSSTTCRSSATSAATATSTASSWSRTRPPRRPSTTTSPSGCCAASSPRRCTRPASTAAPTTAATRSSSCSPPLICDQEHFDEIEQILRDVLDKAGTLL